MSNGSGKEKEKYQMRIIVIDDELNLRRTIVPVLKSMGHEVAAAGNSRSALDQFEKDTFDVALLDLRLGEENGLELMTKLQKAQPRCAMIVTTAFATIETAVEAMRQGAFDYLAKPFTPDQLQQALMKVARTRQLENKVAELESRVSAEAPTPILDSVEPVMQKVYDLAFKAAATPATILILGESGTGKSVLARGIHQKSPQADRPCVTVSCPSLSRELLESELFGHVKGAFTGAVSDTFGKVAAADGGTLFLDEIGELPLEIQPKLLRLLQDKEYERVGETKLRRANVRLITATNRDLEQAVKNGQFREDLYYRLNVISVRMPSLRERPGDLPRIAQEWLRFFGQQVGKDLASFTPEALQALQTYSWPGNLRELRNVIERSTILADKREIDLSDLPENLHRPSSSGVNVGSKASLDELEAEHIRRIIASSSSLGEAAQILGIDPATLYRKRKRMGLPSGTRKPSDGDFEEMPTANSPAETQ
ncbi:MAG TPA: sigma-54 dependent transcriptional regulator [Candidatus Acidoferrum sp.]|nr:sigma-54 dependent transcriptional regulator [Candidatus Acidoferrum sp.]